MTPEIRAAVERLRNYGRYPEPDCTAQPIIDYRADLALLIAAADAGARAREQAIRMSERELGTCQHVFVRDRVYCTLCSANFTHVLATALARVQALEGAMEQTGLGRIAGLTDGGDGHSWVTQTPESSAPAPRARGVRRAGVSLLSGRGAAEG